MDYGLLIKSIDKSIRLAFERKSKSLGVTHVQSKIICFIANNPNVCQNDVLKHFDVKRSTMSETISLMEKNELIKRVKDGRVNYLSLTDKALKINEEMKNLIKEIEDTLIKDINEYDLIKMCENLKKMKSNMEGYNA